MFMGREPQVLEEGLGSVTWGFPWVPCWKAMALASCWYNKHCLLKACAPSFPAGPASTLLSIIPSASGNRPLHPSCQHSAPSTREPRSALRCGEALGGRCPRRLPQEGVAASVRGTDALGNAAALSPHRLWLGRAGRRADRRRGEGDQQQEQSG